VGRPSVAECDHGPCARIDEEGDKIAMDAIDLEDRIADSPTRRTVVKTGVKLAYVAPIVAASFKLREASAQEVMSPGNPNPECRGATCGNFIPCATNPDCICTTTAAGGGFCVPGSTQCAGLADCAADLSCPAGNVCVVNSCCVVPKCVPISLNQECPPVDGTSRSVTRRKSTGKGTIGG
jgi:hypothetical protein